MTRFLDILFSTFLLFLFIPIFIILAVLIKLTSKGPVFYKQIRVGRYGSDFYLYKFRTMRIFSDQSGLLTVGGRDPRITMIGYYIRKYKFDELPQLLNVIKGDMSFVGPRPEVRKYVELYNMNQRKILNFKPGITDFASIFYANENELLADKDEPEKYYIDEIMPNKIELNMKYLNNPSLKQYFSIIFLTLLGLIHRSGK